MTIQQMIDKLEHDIKTCKCEKKFKYQIEFAEMMIDRLKEYMFITSALGITLDVIRDNAGNEFIEHLRNEIDIFNMGVQNILGGRTDG